MTYDGFPGYEDSNLDKFMVGATFGVCLRQRYPGTSWGPWQYVTGTVVRAFRLNNVFPSNTFLGVGAVCR